MTHNKQVGVKMTMANREIIENLRILPTATNHGRTQTIIYKN